MPVVGLALTARLGLLRAVLVAQRTAASEDPQTGALPLTNTQMKNKHTARINRERTAAQVVDHLRKDLQSEKNSSTNLVTTT